ncbi:MBL fold metallo-hydrolase [Pseudomonas stutzeri]|uniref:MBL fold metallo-hydrolase n=1 Tax=Stutzerimonas stutzeri TaxID=316 RepID=UPI00210E7362|nr:MBL fold metallo-hydrolase [Stutzerimonas stutzeri]MCQ4309065.1 MBL fold metallo-hydrolase [Stutzerimonas stutzeri]
MKIIKECLLAVVVGSLVAVPVVAAEQDEASGTRVYTVGTGTPVPESDRAGASVAVVYDGRSFLFDVGSSVSNRLIKLAEEGEKNLAPRNIQHLFITHMHSDHTLGFASVALNLWWLREKQLQVYGPVGTRTLAEHIIKAYGQDTGIRQKSVVGGAGRITDPTPIVSEITEPGVVYDDGEVKVEAFLVDHGDIEPAYGYKVTTPDKVTVISGDTTYDERVAAQAKNADYLIHEVYSEAGLQASTDPKRPQRADYHRNQHASIEQVAKIAEQAQPKLLVLTHILKWTDSVENMQTEMARHYDGRFVFARDAMKLE